MESLDDIQIDVAEPFETLPEDVYHVSVSSIKKKEAVNPFNGQEEVYLQFEFAILGGNSDGKKLYQRVRTKLAADPKPSNLCRIWNATEGKNHVMEDFKSFSLSNLLNKELRVTVKNAEKGGQTYNNIESYLKAPEPTTKEEKEENVLEDLEKGIDE